VYTTESSEDGRPLVAVLSYGFWQQEFGGDPGVIGRAIQMNGRRFEVVAVMRRGFRVPATAQVWVPFIMDERQRSPDRRMSLIATAVARVKPGLTLDGLRARLPQIQAHWRTKLPDVYPAPGPEGGRGVQLVALPFADFLAGPLRSVLLVLMGAVALVLLIACANVGSLQLVRSAERGRELAVRAALGAGRRSLARQLLIENAVLGACGGLVGVALATLLLRVVRITGGPSLALLGDVRLSAAVLAFSAAVTIVAVLVFGGAPAARASRVDLARALNDASRGSTAGVARHRLLGASVVVQVALALVLMLASALSLRSLLRLVNVDPGFRPAQVLTMRVALPSARYRGAQRTAFFDRLVERLSGLPGVEGAGIVYALPFSGDRDSSPFVIGGRQKVPGEAEWHANLQVVSGDYFKAMGIPLLRGRTFTPEDGPVGRRAVIIDETLARTFFPGENPVGKTLAHGTPDQSEIVGVVGDVALVELGAPPKATIYHPQHQFDWLAAFTIAVRSRLEPETLAPQLRAVARAIDPQLPLFDVLPMEERIVRSVTPRRLAVLTLGWFAGLSLLLATLGVSGVIGYRMSQRTQEIGIRVALGAQRSQVMGLVLRQGLGLAALGIAGGTVLYLALAPQLSGLLFRIGARDPLTIIAGALLLAAAAAVASWLPARRAARVDPVAALRGS
jgi:putative ABC transport system permease protein